MIVEELLVALARAHQIQVLAIRAAAIRAVLAAWDRWMVGPDDAAAAEFERSAAPVVEAAARQAAAAALAYVPVAVRAGGLDPVEMPFVPDDYSAPRGVPTPVVLHRAVVEMRTALSVGRPYLEAVAAGRGRARQVAATDPMLASRAAARDAMVAQPAVVGYRRVTDGDACKFCQLASTQRYHDSELMPLHPGCGCTTSPIVGTKDPGQVLDRDLVDRLMIADPTLGKRDEARQQARELAARADTEIAVHDHGELGPTLYPVGIHFDAA